MLNHPLPSEKGIRRNMKSCFIFPAKIVSLGNFLENYHQVLRHFQHFVDRFLVHGWSKMKESVLRWPQEDYLIWGRLQNHRMAEVGRNL